MMVGVGREIRKIILPPSDNGILEKQWSSRAPCWWVNHKEETTGPNIPFCLCSRINYAIYLTGGTHNQWLSKKTTSFRKTTYSTLWCLFTILNGYRFLQIWNTDSLNWDFISLFYLDCIKKLRKSSMEGLKVIFT